MADPMWTLLSVLTGGVFLGALAIGVFLAARSRSQGDFDMGSVSQRWLIEHGSHR
jgi:hypothetical protein